MYYFSNNFIFLTTVILFWENLTYTKFIHFVQEYSICSENMVNKIITFTHKPCNRRAPLQFRRRPVCTAPVKMNTPVTNTKKL